jgi:uncharacterized lipoprotein YmbA
MKRWALMVLAAVWLAACSAAPDIALKKDADKKEVEKKEPNTY